jgi:hypothetical protein
MQYERRKAPRTRVNLSVQWEGALHQESATITDLSTTGCFVLSGGAVQVKELIWLQIELPRGEPVQLWGEVVDAAHEIGFGMKFNSSSDDDQKRLGKYIEGVFASEAHRRTDANDQLS